MYVAVRDSRVIRPTLQRNTSRRTHRVFCNVRPLTALQCAIAASNFEATMFHPRTINDRHVSHVGKHVSKKRTSCQSPLRNSARRSCILERDWSIRWSFAYIPSCDTRSNQFDPARLIGETGRSDLGSRRFSLFTETLGRPGVARARRRRQRRWKFGDWKIARMPLRVSHNYVAVGKATTAERRKPMSKCE